MNNMNNEDASSDVYSGYQTDGMLILIIHHIYNLDIIYHFLLLYRIYGDRIWLCI